MSTISEWAMTWSMEIRKATCKPWSTPAFGLLIRCAEPAAAEAVCVRTDAHPMNNRQPVRVLSYTGISVTRDKMYLTCVLARIPNRNP